VEALRAAADGATAEKSMFVEQHREPPSATAWKQSTTVIYKETSFGGAAIG
jgi:hypothetical protein